MGTQTAVDLRKDARTDLAWPVSVWLPEANRFFNAHSVNISKGGALINLPMTTPVRCSGVSSPGQPVISA